jgi:hypothetical protein
MAHTQYLEKLADLQTLWLAMRYVVYVMMSLQKANHQKKREKNTLKREKK